MYLSMSMCCEKNLYVYVLSHLDKRTSIGYISNPNNPIPSTHKNKHNYP